MSERGCSVGVDILGLGPGAEVDVGNVQRGKFGVSFTGFLAAATAPELRVCGEE